MKLGVKLIFGVILVFVFWGKAFCAEPVSIIYIHGVNAYDTQEVYDEADGLNNAFRGQRLSDDYYFSGKMEVVIWSDLLCNDAAYILYQNGLRDLNTAHNKSKTKDTTEFDEKLLNPFLPVILTKDSGSGGWAVYIRNVINDFLYQVYIINEDKTKQEILLDRIDNATEKIGGKYVIIGHSYGSVVALDYVKKRLIPKLNKDSRFVGLITSADMNTTVNAKYFADIMSKKTKVNVFEYIVKNGKFWICYNHRNDIAAINLPDVNINYSGKNKGFIVSETTKSSYITRLNPFSFDNGKISAHLWMVRRQKDFAKKVVSAYDKKRE